MADWNSEEVKKLRKKLGDTQEEFAKRFRLTVDAVRVWEQGRGLPPGPVTVIMDDLARRLIFVPSPAKPPASHANGVRKARAARPAAPRSASPSTH